MRMNFLAESWFCQKERAVWLNVHRLWAQILPLSLTNCVTLGKLSNLMSIYFLAYKWKMITYLAGL